MSDPVAKAVTEAITRRRSGASVAMRRATYVSGDTVSVNGGTVVVDSWVTKPAVAGDKVLLLVQDGANVGLSLGVGSGLDIPTADARYVNIDGDRMTGSLVGSDAQGKVSVVSPMLANVLAYADKRGATLVTTLTGTATGGPGSAVLDPVGASNYAISGGASGGTVTVTVSATAALTEPPFVPSDASWTPFMQWRNGNETGITSITAEIQDSTGAWVATLPSTPGVPSSGLWTAGNQVLSNYPPRGVRFVVTLAPGAGPYYLRQVGLWHRAIVPGSATYLSKRGGYVYGELDVKGILYVIGDTYLGGPLITSDRIYLDSDPDPDYGEVQFRRNGTARWILRGPSGTGDGLVLLYRNDDGSAVGAHTFDRSGTVLLTGQLTAGAGGGAFYLKPGPSADHVYMAFYPRSASPNTRGAYMGFASAGATNFVFANEAGISFEMNKKLVIADSQGNQLNLACGGSGKSLLLRNDGSDCYFMVSDSYNGSYNSLRPWRIRLSDGMVFSEIIYQKTTAPAANVVVGSDGALWRSTSSYRYKHDIAALDGSPVPGVPYDRTLREAAARRTKDAPPAASTVLDLTPARFVGDGQQDQFRTRVGLIAEDVAEVYPPGLSDSGDAIEWPSITTALLQVVKDQQSTINDLAARVAALEGAAHAQ